MLVLRALFATVVPLAAAVNAPPSLGQTREAGGIVVSAKIHPHALERAQSEPLVPVFIVLEHQPQREIVQQAEGTNALYRQAAEARYRQAAETMLPRADELRQARQAVDAVVLRTRQQAVRAIEQAIKPEQDELEGRLKELGATRISRYLGINMLSAEIPATAIPALASDPAIAEVFPVEQLRSQLATSVPALGAPAFWAAGYTGQGESVGLLDTGVRADHPALAAVSVRSQVFLTNGRTDSCFGDDISATDDRQGHGTYLAGIIASQGSSGWSNYLGVANGLAMLYSLKVGYLTLSSGNCDPSQAQSDQRDVIAALDWALTNTPLKIFNYSFGTETTADDDGFARAMDSYIDTYGLVITVSGGNFIGYGGPPPVGFNWVTTPGIAYNSLTVGSWQDPTSRSHTMAYRRKPDVLGPGKNVFSTAYNWYATAGTSDDFATESWLNASSAAAAHIAGAVALLGSAGVSDPLAAKAILVNSGDWAGLLDLPSVNLARAEGQLYYYSGSMTTGGVDFYKLHANGEVRATLAWNRHVNAGTSLFNRILLYLTDTHGNILSGAGGPQDTVASAGTTYNGDMIVSVTTMGDPLVGVESEPYAVAFSAPATRALGLHITAACDLPDSTAPGSSVSVTCTATNDGDMDAAWVGGVLTVPTGFGTGTDFAPMSFGTLRPGQTATAQTTLTTAPAGGTYGIRWDISSTPGFFAVARASGTKTIRVDSGLLPPVLLSPANGSIVSTAPTLAWAAASGATSYDVYFGASPTVPAFNTKETSYNLGWLGWGPLDADALNHWWVVAKDGINAVASTTWSFTTQPAAPDGPHYVIATAAGNRNGTLPIPDGAPATSGRIFPGDLSAGSGGKLYFTDSYNVRALLPDGTVTTIAGDGQCHMAGYADDPGTCGPGPLAVARDGSLYVGDGMNHRVFRITPDGSISRVTGMGSSGGGFSGDGGPATDARITGAGGLAVDSAGNLFISDAYRIRKVDGASGVITTVAGNGTAGQSGDGGPAIAAQITGQGIALDSAGNLFLACGERIREISANGIITTVAGGGTASPSDGDGGPATAVRLQSTSRLAVDASRNLFFSETNANQILRVDANGILHVLAGNYRPVYSGDGGPAKGATLNQPGPLAAAEDGSVFVSEYNSEVVRVLVPTNAGCAFQVSPTAAVFGNQGRILPITISTQPDCGWVVGDLPVWAWSQVAGHGARNLNLSVLPNASVLRSAVLTIAGTSVAISQGGGPCSYALGDSAANVPGDPGSGAIVLTTGPGCPWLASSSADWVKPVVASGVGSATLRFSFGANTGSSRSATLTVAGLPFSVQQSASAAITGLRFVPVTPCRLSDSRFGSGPFNGPTLAAGETRSIPIPQSGCGIPSTAEAYSLNVTVVPKGRLSYLTLFPLGQTQPGVSTLNSWNGIVVANAAIVPAGDNGAVSLFVTDPTDVILDINGYFASPSVSGSLSFYTASPCRVADTRAATGPFGGPSLSDQQSRNYAVPSAGCNIPSTASAYSMNLTVVPPGYLGFLSVWPTGQPRPNASTLNSWTGKVVANAALVPAGTNQSVSVYASNPTDLVMDLNGYFGAPGSAGALNFYPVAPCRLADTRYGTPPFGGLEMEAQATRTFPIPASGCNIPSTAAAYSLNVTVVPDGVLSYLTAWPTGSARPNVSTLNSFDGAVVANAAIVPAGTNGAIGIYVTNPTHVILDINGYFAP